jgi:glycosyltransferase involved in cell wall biosynthesis
MIRSPINVLHVTSSLGGGGAERRLVKSLAVMDRVRFSHQVCCVSSGGIYENELKALNIPCRMMRRRARFDASVVLQMAALMRRERIDVVHASNFTANAWGRVSALLAGVQKIVAHECGTAWTESATMRSVDRALSRVTDVWLANSEATRIVLTQHVGVPEHLVRVVYNGVPSLPESGQHKASLRKGLRLDPDVPLVGAVGRFDTPKGHSYLLRAVPYVLKVVPEAHFVLVGDGPLRQLLEYEVAQLSPNARRQVHMTGFLIEAPHLMQEMTLLVQPSIREPLANSLIEAAFAAIPVVGTNVDGIPEIVVHGETGALVECTEPVQHVSAPGTSPLPQVVVDGRTRRLRMPRAPDPLALADAIVDLLRDARLRSQMGERARGRAKRRFSLDRYVHDLEAVYLGD